MYSFSAYHTALSTLLLLLYESGRYAPGEGCLYENAGSVGCLSAADTSTQTMLIGWVLSPFTHTDEFWVSSAGDDAPLCVK